MNTYAALIHDSLIRQVYRLLPRTKPMSLLVVWQALFGAVEVALEALGIGLIGAPFDQACCDACTCITSESAYAR